MVWTICPYQLAQQHMVLIVCAHGKGQHIPSFWTWPPVLQSATMLRQWRLLTFLAICVRLLHCCCLLEFLSFYNEIQLFLMNCYSVWRKFWVSIVPVQVWISCCSFWPTIDSSVVLCWIRDVCGVDVSLLPNPVGCNIIYLCFYQSSFVHMFTYLPFNICCIDCPHFPSIMGPRGAHCYASTSTAGCL